MSIRAIALTLIGCVCSFGFVGSALAQAPGEHDENAMFGAPSAPVDAGATPKAPPAPVDGGAAAEGQHDENAIFGNPGPSPESPPPAGSEKAPTEHEPVTDQNHTAAEGQMFGNSAPGHETDDRPSANAVPEDPLKIGGLLYLRSQITASKNQPPSEWVYDMPNLLDIYFDARPNDRVRGFVVGRLTYDPTINETAPTAFGQPPQKQLQPFLDQMWLNFDIEREVFVTAGKQHVKWGTGHFWNPTDFLQPVRLDPLAVFDSRTGVDLIKAHVPWEKRGWNFYGFALLDSPQEYHTVNNVGAIGGAARAEIVLGPAEIGFDGVVQKGVKPRFGVDLSSGLGPFDVYAEAAFRSPNSDKLWRLHNDTFNPELGLANFELYTPNQSLETQVTGGLSWQTDFRDNDAFTIGAEYFYNPLGTDNPILYPWLIEQGQFTPFYAGQHYAGVYANVLIPTENVFSSNSFTLSTLGNLSDKSFITRLDYSITVLTHLMIEAYGDVHYGTEGGEFRFGFNTTSIPSGNGQIPAVVVPTPLFDVGLALRIAI